ncbi:MAG: ATP-binding cassette domain-containing protein [Peptoniphilaceae bacterium]|nr:ATP-binding cassette domain-containing protein [Peptoniphilaceae bacterium]MDY6018746.1 ATP-binding cassette domain-containing protein [Anaerococcus sp.]
MLEVNIYKDFGSFVLDVDFKSKEGVLGILGASGSGKSLSLKCISGIVRPDRGRIVLNDRVLFDSEKKINLKVQDRLIGYLFQDYALFPNMTVYENIAAGIRNKDCDFNAIVGQKLQELNLLAVKDKYPTQISGGEKQRAALARILVNDAELLILDEPYSAIDQYLRWTIELDIKKTIEKYKIQTLFVSHDMDEAYRMCDSIVVMNKGKAEKMKKTEELFKNPETLSAAELSGCKNFTSLKHLSKDLYYAEAWDLELRLDSCIKSDFIGIRSPYIKLGDKDLGINSYQLEVIEEIEELFGYTIIARKAASKKGGFLRIEIDKEKWTSLKNKEDLYFQIDKNKLLFLQK